MHRRTLLRGIGAAAVGVPAASLAGASSAQAAETYHVALCEKGKNQILIHARNEAWTPSNEIWRWAPPVAIDEKGANTWTNLSDIKFRNTSAFGWIALVTASYGKVGIVNMGDDDALLWSARPYGNPHAIEHIPHLGVTVTASSIASSRIKYPGFLTVYAPTRVDDLSTLTRVQEISFQGAHGLWYDGSYIWALGAWTLAKYKITGDHLNARLVADQVYQFPERFDGHSLDTDYSDPRYLLISGTGVVKRVNKATGAISSCTPSGGGVKSFSRVASGSSFWQQATEDWWSHRIQFFDNSGAFVENKELSGYGYAAEFYKARVSSTDFS
ncbi:hypothetical protein ACWGQ4_02490 [Streptomyces sp. NPDC055721]|uniref:hypothetical protein n=1 Tax=Streptomyces sp. NPDC127132 TaxID=3345374 RepID=UPI0036309422